MLVLVNLFVHIILHRYLSFNTHTNICNNMQCFVTGAKEVFPIVLCRIENIIPRMPGKYMSSGVELPSGALKLQPTYSVRQPSPRHSSTILRTSHPLAFNILPSTTRLSTVWQWGWSWYSYWRCVLSPLPWWQKIRYVSP